MFVFSNEFAMGVISTLLANYRVKLFYKNLHTKFERNRSVSKLI